MTLLSLVSMKHTGETPSWSESGEPVTTSSGSCQLSPAKVSRGVEAQQRTPALAASTRSQGHCATGAVTAREKGADRKSRTGSSSSSSELNRRRVEARFRQKELDEEMRQSQLRMESIQLDRQNALDELRSRQGSSYAGSDIDNTSVAVSIAASSTLTANKLRMHDRATSSQSSQHASNSTTDDPVRRSKRPHWKSIQANEQLGSLPVPIRWVKADFNDFLPSVNDQQSPVLEAPGLPVSLIDDPTAAVGELKGCTPTQPVYFLTSRLVSRLIYKKYDCTGSENNRLYGLRK